MIATFADLRAPELRPALVCRQRAPARLLCHRGRVA